MFSSNEAKVVEKAIKGLTQNEFFFAHFEQSLEITGVYSHSEGLFPNFSKNIFEK